jgi:hypothetical protein
LPNLYRKNTKNPIKDSFVKKVPCFWLRNSIIGIIAFFPCNLQCTSALWTVSYLSQLSLMAFFLLLRYIMCSFKCILKVGVEESIVNASRISYLNLLWPFNSDYLLILWIKTTIKSIWPSFCKEGPLQFCEPPQTPMDTPLTIATCTLSLLSILLFSILTGN